MSESAPMTVVFRLAAMLEAAEMSQRELARRSGVSLVTINGIANNRTARVDLETLDRLCAVLECEPGELLVREGKAKRRK